MNFEGSVDGNFERVEVGIDVGSCLSYTLRISSGEQ